MTPVLIVEDKESLRVMLQQTMEAAGYPVDAVGDGREAIEKLSRSRYLAVLTDLKLPRADGHAVLRAALEADDTVPVIVMTAYGTIEDAVAAMKAGAFDFLAKPVDTDHLLLLIQRALERRRLLLENILLREEFASRLGLPRILGEHPSVVEASRQVQRVAATDATVLLLGESGTGKELFARAIHHLSPRRERPFVAVSCAAIPETLIENELFGHEKGAYTGASGSRIGRMEMADRGTVFLDEIGELPFGVQAKLLRVLQERAFERIGGNRTIEVDIRIVAATNRDLAQAVADKSFREDLYFRLSVVPIAIPPLRERSSDIPILARHFLEKCCREAGRRPMEISTEAMALLEAHDWPGNIRELENSLERAAIVAEGNAVLPEHLDLPARRRDRDAEALRRMIGPARGPDEASAKAAALAERVWIEEALRSCRGDRRKAAAELGLSPRDLGARLERLGIG
jgi:DNA-binding NtrC family response regulator